VFLSYCCPPNWIAKPSSFVVDSAVLAVVLLFVPFNSSELTSASIAAVVGVGITSARILVYNSVVVCPSFINLG